MIDESYRGFRLRSDELGDHQTNVRITAHTPEAKAVLRVHVLHQVGKRNEATPEQELIARFKSWVDEHLDS